MSLDFWQLCKYARRLHLSYSVIEYDYKYCSFRSPEKHAHQDNQCNCDKSKKGKLTSIFLNNSKITWWMSKRQMKRHQKLFPFLNNGRNRVLSSVFSDNTIENLTSLNIKNKDDTWLILNSPSWIKGVDDATNYAKNNDLQYELVWNLQYKELLKKLATAKGVIFFPKGGDTCPRWTIEAKILGCELIINDNVQHNDEEWFFNRETILPYLKERADYFWSFMEDAFCKVLNLPENQQEKNGLGIKFKIIVPFYNSCDWITKTIKSLKRQQYRNFECILVDDMSTDKSVETIRGKIKNDDRFTLIENKEKKYALQNIVEGIERLSCEDEDVIIVLDGDDWLASTRTLSKLRQIYADKDSFMTYGSYVFNPSGQRGPEPSEYPENVVENNAFREDVWRASHLRSFKYKLWKELDLDDLKGPSGKYYEMTYDQAIMLPLLEMSGNRAKFIDNILYVYNKDNPLNVDKIKAQKQHALALEIRKNKKYNRI